MKDADLLFKAMQFCDEQVTKNHGYCGNCRFRNHLCINYKGNICFPNGATSMPYTLFTKEFREVICVLRG